MSDSDDALGGLKTDLKILQQDMTLLRRDFSSLEIRLAEMLARMPSMDRLQQLEIQMTTLNTQFKVVWAGLGTLTVVSLGTLTLSILRVAGLG